MLPELSYLEQGGSIMWLIALDAALLFAFIAERTLFLWSAGTRLNRRHQELYHLYSADLQAHHQSCERIGTQHALVGLAEHPEITRYFALIRALIAIAPLLGLLGTVGGIIATFDDLLRGAPVASMGSGISVALLTTQLGMGVAIPGLIAERLLVRRADRIAHVHDLAAANAQKGVPYEA